MDNITPALGVSMMLICFGVLFILVFWGLSVMICRVLEREFNESNYRVPRSRVRCITRNGVTILVIDRRADYYKRAAIAS